MEWNIIYFRTSKPIYAPPGCVCVCLAQSSACSGRTRQNKTKSKNRTRPLRRENYRSTNAFADGAAPEQYQFRRRSKRILHLGAHQHRSRRTSASQLSANRLAQTPPHNPHPTDSTARWTRTHTHTKNVHNERPSSRRGDNFDGVLTKISAISPRRRGEAHRLFSAALRTVFECATDLVIDTNLRDFARRLWLELCVWQAGLVYSDLCK